MNIHNPVNMLLYCTVTAALQYLNLKLSSAKLSHFCQIWRGFGAIMNLLELKGGAKFWEEGVEWAWASFTVSPLWTELSALSRIFSKFFVCFVRRQKMTSESVSNKQLLHREKPLQGGAGRCAAHPFSQREARVRTAQNLVRTKLS